MPPRLNRPRASGLHDWSDGLLLSRLLGVAAKRQLIGPATEARVDWEERPVPGPIPVKGMAAALI